MGYLSWARVFSLLDGQTVFETACVFGGNATYEMGSEHGGLCGCADIFESSCRQVQTRTMGYIWDPWRDFLDFGVHACSRGGCLHSLSCHHGKGCEDAQLPTLTLAWGHGTFSIYIYIFIYFRSLSYFALHLLCIGNDVQPPPPHHLD